MLEKQANIEEILMKQADKQRNRQNNGQIMDKIMNIGVKQR